MTTSTASTKSDHPSLAYAGMMGHPYALVHVGRDGRAEVGAECNSVESADRFAVSGDRLYERHNDATTYRRTGCRYRLVKRYA
jgi:hypothetical protein